MFQATIISILAITLAPLVLLHYRPMVGAILLGFYGLLTAIVVVLFQCTWLLNEGGRELCMEDLPSEQISEDSLEDTDVVNQSRPIVESMAHSNIANPPKPEVQSDTHGSGIGTAEPLEELESQTGTKILQKKAGNCLVIGSIRGLYYGKYHRGTHHLPFRIPSQSQQKESRKGSDH